MMKSRVVPWSLFLLAAVFVPSTACTVFVNSDSAQCQTSAECTDRGPAFQGTTCGPRQTCIPLEGYCATNQECIDRAGSETVFCQKSSEGNKCVSLLTRECGKLLADPGDLANDDAVVLGMVWMGSWNPTLAAAENGFELARRDFKNAQGGVPPLPGKKTRPIVVLDCDIPIAAPGTHKLAVDHLVNDVKVPVILGPLLADWINYAVVQAVPKGITVMSPDPAYAGLEGLAGIKDHYFSNAVPAAAEPRVAALLVSEEEKLIRASGVARPLKVALLTPGGVATEFSRVFFTSVRFNGLSAAENSENYKEVLYGDAAESAQPNSRFSTAIVTVANYKPDVVACLGAGCRAATPALEKAGITPYYILSGESASSSLAEGFGGTEATRKRVLGMRPGRALRDERVAVWYNRFGATFPDLQPQPLATGTYDLFYYAAFGIGAVGDKPITGTSVGEAISNRFKPGGRPASTIPEGIIKTFNSLSDDQAVVDMDGTMTTGNFDSSGRLLSYVMQVWCIDRDPTKLNRITDSGLSFDSETGALSGTNTCF